MVKKWVYYELRISNAISKSQIKTFKTHDAALQHLNSVDEEAMNLLYLVNPKKYEYKRDENQAFIYSKETPTYNLIFVKIFEVENDAKITSIICSDLSINKSSIEEHIVFELEDLWICIKADNNFNKNQNQFEKLMINLGINQELVNEMEAFKKGDNQLLLKNNNWRQQFVHLEQHIL